MPAERPLHWSEEDQLNGKISSYPEQEDIPSDYITRNKLFWRKARRGIISRPMEIPAFLSNLLHQRITKTFGLSQVEQPTVVWSAIFDNPRSPNSEYVYERRYPDDVPEEERTNYAIGIERINEYASNYAAREFIRRNMDFPVGKQIATVYGTAMDIFTYRGLFNGTYGIMRDLEIMAESDGLNYKTALFQGFFNHNFTAINTIIAEHTGLHDVTELATEIGRRRFNKLDLSKWIRKL